MAHGDVRHQLLGFVLATLGVEGWAGENDDGGTTRPNRPQRARSFALSSGVSQWLLGASSGRLGHNWARHAGGLS
ncbi:MAG: hypothetical protein QOD24_4470 [Solirubrobacteraceae bacterium]|nr:hypothetical protein [Solirubrobacteraceae bacterium]